MSESGDTSRDAKSASVQSESKSEPKMESDGDNDRPDQHFSLVGKEMTQKTTDSDSEEDGDDTQSNTNSNAKVDKENYIENKQRPEGVTEELTNPSFVPEQQENTIHSSTITKKNVQMDNEPIIERTEVTPKTAADESDQKEDGITKEDIDTSKDSQQQKHSSQSNTSTITEKDIKMDNEPKKSTEEKTEEVKDTSTDSQEQDDSNTSTITKKDIKMDNEPKKRTEEKTEDIIDPSTDSQEQDDSNTMPITEKDIKMDNEPSKRTEEKTEEVTNTSTDNQDQEDYNSQSNTSTIAKKDIKMDNEPRKRTEVTPKTAADESDQKEDGMTKKDKDTSKDSQQQDDSSQSDTSATTKKDIKMDNEPGERTEDVVTPNTVIDASDQKEDGMTKKDIDTSEDSQQQKHSSQSDTSTITKKDIKIGSEPSKRTEDEVTPKTAAGESVHKEDGMTKKDIETSKDSQQQDDSSQSDTSATTKKDIKIGSEPSKRTEDLVTPKTAAGESVHKEDGMTKEDIDTSATTKKDIKMDNEPGERTEDVMTPKTAAGESDQKEDGMTKKDIETSKDSQQQNNSSQSDTSTITEKNIKIGSEPSKRTKEKTEEVKNTSTDSQEQDDSNTSPITKKDIKTDIKTDNEPRKRTEVTQKTAAGESVHKEDGMTKKDIDTSKDSQQQKHSSESNTSTITKKDIKMDNEPGERTEDEVTPKTAVGESVRKEDGMTKEDIDASKDSQQQDIKMDNEPGERTEDVVTTKTTAGPPSIKEKAIWWWILPVVAIILAMVCAALYNPDSTPPVQKENNVVELFTEKLNKVESSFPNQRPELWRRSRLHISRHLKTASPTEPVSLILTSGHGAERTLGCLAKRLAEAFSTAQNSSVLNIYGKSKSLQDSDQVKLDIDNDLREAFDGEKLAAVIHRFEELPPGSTLIFYRYCDHENAAYKKVLLVFTVMLNAELEITDNISLGSVEDMVHDQLKRKFVSSDKSALFNQMDVDKLSGLWSRISHLILPVAAEEDSIQQGCGLESF